MKAIRKSDGKEIEVTLFKPRQYLSAEKKDGVWQAVYLEDGLILEEPVDWNAFRREAAKANLAAMLVEKNWRYHPDDPDPNVEEAQKRAAKRAAYSAIVYADELIKQLREEK